MAKRRRGFFLVLDGLDKCGKSTQITLLAKRWKKLGLPVTVTREPGGTALGERVRELLLDRNQTVAPLSELLLYEASRSQHVEQVIRPALKKGHIVLCDRFSLSTLAYQGQGRGLSMSMVRQLDRWAVNGVNPDLTIVLDAPLAVTLKRLGGQRDRMEQKSALLKRVREAYIKLSQILPKVQLVDAQGQMEEVQQRILRLIQRQKNWDFPES